MHKDANYNYTLLYELTIDIIFKKFSIFLDRKLKKKENIFKQEMFISQF